MPAGGSTCTCTCPKCAEYQSRGDDDNSSYEYYTASDDASDQDVSEDDNGWHGKWAEENNDWNRSGAKDKNNWQKDPDEFEYYQWDSDIEWYDFEKKCYKAPAVPEEEKYNNGTPNYFSI